MTEIDITIEADPVRAIGVPATSVDVLILNGPAELTGWSLREAAGEAPIGAEGSVTSPAAGAQIAGTVVLAAGTYNVDWTVGLAGTLAAADANNFQLRNAVTGVLVSANLAVAGDYPQQPIQLVVAQATTVNVIAIALGTVGAIYTAQITVTPVTTSDALVEIQDGNNALAEISLGAGGADSRTYTDTGIKIRNRINLHVISGTVTGAIFARFQKNTG